MGRPFLLYARHGRYLGSERLLWALTRRTTSERQLRERERAWGGSLEANPGLDEQELRTRHKRRGKLARDSKAQKGSKRTCVNAARVRGKRPYLIRGGLLSEKGAEVSRGRSSRWSHDHPGGAVKAAYRAKGRTVRKLSRKKQGNVGSRHLGEPDWPWGVG
jgi:hypothetical protein